MNATAQLRLLAIVYDSHVYQIDQLPSTPNQAGQFYWAVFPDQGPNVWGTHLGVQTLPNHVDSVRYTTAPGFCGSNMITVYSNFQYTDPQGTIHPFSSSLFTEQAPASLGCLDQPNAQATAIDGSGYWISVTSYNHYVVYDLHGNEVNNDTDSIGAVDSNGNRIPPGKGDVLARIIRESEDKRSLLCYKHVD